jgi:hypothetical protein
MCPRTPVKHLLFVSRELLLDTYINWTSFLELCPRARGPYGRVGNAYIGGALSTSQARCLLWEPRVTECYHPTVTKHKHSDTLTSWRARQTLKHHTVSRVKAKSTSEPRRSKYLECLKPWQSYGAFF